MKTLLRILLVIVLMGSFNSAVLAEDPEVNDPDAATEEVAVEKKELPDSVDMDLAFDNAGDNPVLPEGFRGGDPDSGLIHCLEDVYYEKQEHSIIYNPEASEIGEDAKFESKPNITWDTKMKGPDGEWLEATEEEGADPDPNTNIARNGGKFYAPGEYQIGNGGAREVSGGAQTVDATTPEPGDEEAAGGAQDVDGLTPEQKAELEAAGGAQDVDGLTPEQKAELEAAGGAQDVAGLTPEELAKIAEGEQKTVTAKQTMGVLVHDCTAPDVCIAFQEAAGSVDVVETSGQLKNKLILAVLDSKGKPFEKDAEILQEASCIFIDEGKNENRNLVPNEKTARLSLSGALFNKYGEIEVNSGIIKSKLLDKGKQTRRVFVAGGPDKDCLKGVFVRRNVPFIIAATSVDNASRRKTLGDVVCRIERKDGSTVDPEEEVYQFRIPNYPRDEYPEQTDYYFISSTEDAEGNVTSLRMPLYVVNTQATYEGAANQ